MVVCRSFSGSFILFFVMLFRWKKESSLRASYFFILRNTYWLQRLSIMACFLAPFYLSLLLLRRPEVHHHENSERALAFCQSPSK